MPDIYGDSDDSDDCGPCCCCCGCNTIGYLFFCKRMRKKSKIQLLWGWLLTLATASCLLLGMVIYAPDKPFATPSDMRPVKHNFNYYFCAEAEVTSPDVEFGAFLVSGHLKINRQNRQIYSWDTAMYIDRLGYDYFSFYFLPGSGLNVKQCSREFMTMYLFKSVHNFNTWQKDRECEFCYLEKRYIEAHDTCNERKYFQPFSVVLNEEDDYFLVYENGGDAGGWIDVDVNLKRTVYDLQNAEIVCIDVTDCKVEIDDPDQTAVFQVKDYYDIGMFNHPQFTTKCVPRIWAYFVFHGVIVLLIGLVSSCLIQKCCKDPESVRLNGYNIQTNERSPLLRGACLPPSYSSAALTPPKYEDLVPNYDKDLPSYRDVMAATVTGSFVRDRVDSSTHAHDVVLITNETSPRSNTRITNQNSQRGHVTLTSSTSCNVQRASPRSTYINDTLISPIHHLNASIVSNHNFTATNAKGTLSHVTSDATVDRTSEVMPVVRSSVAETVDGNSCPECNINDVSNHVTGDPDHGTGCHGCSTNNEQHTMDFQIGNDNWSSENT